MTLLAFDAGDMARSVRDVFASEATYGDFGGLTRAQYRAIEHCEFCRPWTPISPERCGCEDAEALRLALAKCHAYNLVKARRKEALGDVLAAYGCSDGALEGGTLDGTLARASLDRLLEMRHPKRGSDSDGFGVHNFL